MAKLIDLILNWIWKLLYVNFLWLIFTISGLVVFGLFPSTISLFIVIRKFFINKGDFPIFKTFFTTFKKEFVKTNLFGLVFYLIGFVLYIDFKFFVKIEMPTMVSHVTLSILISLTLIYIITLLYFFPVYAHFKFKGIQYLKNSLIIGMSNPLTTIQIVLSFVIAIYIMSHLTGLIPLLGTSILSFIVVFFTLKRFKKIEAKRD